MQEQPAHHNANNYRLIAKIYKISTNPEEVAGLAPVIAAEFGSKSALISWCQAPPLCGRGLPEVVSATPDLGESAVLAYRGFYDDRNSLRFVDGVVIRSSIVTFDGALDNPTQLPPEWQEYCAQLNIFHCLGASFRADSNVYGMIGIHRPPEAAPFDKKDRKKLLDIIPHLQSGLDIYKNMRSDDCEPKIANEILQRLPVKIVIVGDGGTILFMNESARLVIQEGKNISVFRNKLRFSYADKTNELNSIIGKALVSGDTGDRDSFGVVSVPDIGGGVFSVIVFPMHGVAGRGLKWRVAVVTFGEPEQEIGIKEDLLRQIFGLTDAEAHVLAALVEGVELAEYAEARKISIHTVRSQVKRILEKSGYSRQIDLIRLLVSNPFMRLVAGGTELPRRSGTLSDRDEPPSRRQPGARMRAPGEDDS